MDADSRSNVVGVVCALDRHSDTSIHCWCEFTVLAGKVKGDWEVEDEPA